MRRDRGRDCNSFTVVVLMMCFDALPSKQVACAPLNFQTSVREVLLVPFLESTVESRQGPILAAVRRVYSSQLPCVM